MQLALLAWGETRARISVPQFLETRAADPVRRGGNAIGTGRRPSVQFTLNRGLTPRHEIFPVCGWALRGCQFLGVITEIYAHHTRGDGKLLGIAVRGICERALHELGPDGQRRFGTFQVQLTAVVESYPNHA